jgi:hypothetical protein
LERLHLQDPQQTTKKFVSGGRQEFRSAQMKSCSRRAIRVGGLGTERAGGGRPHYLVGILHRRWIQHVANCYLLSKNTRSLCALRRAASTIVVLVPLDGRCGSRLDRRLHRRPSPTVMSCTRPPPRASRQSFLLNIISIIRE